MSWLLVILGFSALIILHEAGHFVAAKATGMRVERFFLFFGPKLVSFKRGETEYGIGTIPLGGYVKIAGMEWPGSRRHDEAQKVDGTDSTELEPGELPELPSNEPDPRGYLSQPIWKRMVVIGAGPAVNIALAFAVFFFVAFDFPEGDGTIKSVMPGSPAAIAHLRPGDRLVSVDGKSFAGMEKEQRLLKFGDLVSAHKCPEIPPVAGCKASTPAVLGIDRNGHLGTVRVYPTYVPKEKRVLLGIRYAAVPAAATAGEAASFALNKMWFVASRTFNVVSHIFESRQRKEISSVVGIGDVGHEVVGLGVVPSLMLLALVSLSLGLLNLMPFLPLDGGHIFWSLVEKVRGKPVSFRVIEGASALGLVLIATLMFIGLSNDIGRLSGEGFHVR